LTRFLRGGGALSQTQHYIVYHIFNSEEVRAKSFSRDLGKCRVFKPAAAVSRIILKTAVKEDQNGAAG
jgi:hypothetical protein